MVEEIIYDKQRILMVLFVFLIIIGAGLIIAVAWPKPSPSINDIQTDFSIITDSDTISDKYTEMFNGTIDTNNTILYKIVLYADDYYFMQRVFFTIKVDKNDTNIVGIIFTNYYNEENIVFGDNAIPILTTNYLRTVLVEPGKYILYIFLDIFSDDYSIDYNIRISE